MKITMTMKKRTQKIVTIIAIIASGSYLVSTTQGFAASLREKNNANVTIETKADVNLHELKNAKVGVLKLKGISCQSCGKTISKALMKNENVIKTSFNLAKAKIKIFVKKGANLSNSQIETIVSDCGKYKVKSITWLK